MVSTTHLFQYSVDFSPPCTPDLALHTGLGRFGRHGLALVLPGDILHLALRITPWVESNLPS